ncbi:unnamed protein product [Rotaria sp. Silwood1]|nr:unnamed protein product [Rotaria sp. Silwood1]CAF1357142.1 unnamed protein product [Rotaria sp. Silwood1]CAF3566792.1 unnamed protein product [Rotaria sp. Silwood1]
MMFFVKNFLYFILLHLVIASPQINLHLTDEISNNTNDVVFQHDCLHVLASTEKQKNIHQIVSYCLTEWLSELNIEENNLDQKFTFNQLYKQNITSQQLYLWSAPMNVVERYQFYLNDLSNSNKSSFMATQLFYNCTLPRFGPLCQYSLDNYVSDNSSLYEFIYKFYQNEYNPINLICYTHLECNRGSTLICLDWAEICDGTIDCHDGIDEEFCWQLQVNDCEENEYQCVNGQCISKIFFNDDHNSFECLDRTDEIWRDMRMNSPFSFKYNREPTFTMEDITCPKHHNPSIVKLTSSCVFKRTKLLEKFLLDDKPNGLSDHCWLAVKCQSGIYDRLNSRCHIHCSTRTCKEIINQTCLDILQVPAVMINSTARSLSPSYICYNDQLCDGFYPNKSLISFNNATCRRPEDFPLNFNSFELSRVLVDDRWCHCGYDQYGFCDDEELNIHYIRKHISFTTICDGFTELIPVTINERSETDETECEY